MPGSRRTRRGDGEHERRACLVGELQELTAEQGPDLTLRQFCRATGRPASHVYRDFDAWADLRAAAGLSPQISRRASRTHTRESLIAALRQAVSQQGPALSRVQFSRLTGISPHPILRVFGSWRALREAAGYTAHPRSGMPATYTRVQLEDLLRRLVAEQGPHITLHEFCRTTGVSPSTVDRLVGWGELRLGLGLMPSGSRRAAEFERSLAGEPLDPRILAAATSPIDASGWARLQAIVHGRTSATRARRAPNVEEGELASDSAPDRFP